jgi:hypothetical protein
VATTCNGRSERDICLVDRTIFANVSRLIFNSAFLKYFLYSRDDFEIDNFNKFCTSSVAGAKYLQVGFETGHFFNRQINL